MWDTRNGKELFTLNGHAGYVLAVAMLPNGWLASGSFDTTIKLWDLREKSEVKTLLGHTHSVVSLKVLKNGNLASCSCSGAINVWNPYLNVKNLLLTIDGDRNSWGVLFSVLSNDFLVTCFCDEKEEGKIRVWNSSDGKLIKSQSTGLKSVWSILVLFNDQVAIGATDGMIKIFDLTDDKKTRIIKKAHDDWVQSILQLSNSNLVSLGREDYSFPFIYSIKVWNFADLTLLQNIKTDHILDITSASISHDETMLATGSYDMTIKLWPIRIKKA